MRMDALDEESQDRRAGGRQKARESRRGNAQIMVLTYIFAAVFFGMIIHFVYFMVTDSQEIINNPYNKRQEALAKKVTKGKILSADGKILAETKTDEEGNDKRIYPYNKVYCHVVGRTTNSMTAIEKDYCYPLLTSHTNPFSQLANTFRGEKNPGDNVITTLDSRLQEIAYQALGNRKGAVVALEPSTGKILAMVSSPSYNPNEVEKNWDNLIEDSKDESKLINRATQGLYPPGSTFKILTAMEYILENKENYKNYTYQCHGSDSFSGNIINCYGKEVHGKLTLETAFAKSCNGAFAQIGTTLDRKAFRKLAEKFMFNEEIPILLETNAGQFSLSEKSDMGELTQTVIGQGKTTITPLQNAMIAATVANDGEMMIPYVVDKIENADGKAVKTYEPKSKGQIVDEWTAKQMQGLMKAVVQKGTAYSLSYLSESCAGKTGSAEIDSNGTSHAWFVGYAPAKNPKIAVSVIVEEAGTGSQHAVPIAKELFAYYLK